MWGDTVIVSASRRTDIPAFYGEWFMNRLRDGFVLVPNPFHVKRVSRIELSPKLVDGIVFWSKNPEPFLKFIPEICCAGYDYYFTYTLTGYGRDVEGNVPELSVKVDNFLKASELCGKERVDWRYDPVLLTDVYTVDWHREMFSALCRRLSGYADRCIISFLDYYRGIPSVLQAPDDEQVSALAESFSRIASECGIALYTCAEKVDLEGLNIHHASCIDPEKFKCLTGSRLCLPKDKNQRMECGCAESIDIGSYGTCRHGCAYCYASKGNYLKNRTTADRFPEQPFINGVLCGDEIITTRKVVSSRIT